MIGLVGEGSAVTMVCLFFSKAFDILLLRIFCCSPWGGLDTHLCWNIEKKNKQCFGQSLNHNWFYRKSEKMLLEAILYIHLHQHQSCEHQHGAPQPSLGSIPQHQLCCPKVDSEPGVPGWLKEKAVAVSYHQGKLYSLTMDCSASGIPSCFQPVNPFCSWTFLPSVLDYSWVTKYHWRAVTM